MLIHRKLTQQKEMWKQEADAATPTPAEKESLIERFFRTHQHLEVKENGRDVNNNGGVPKQS